MHTHLTDPCLHRLTPAERRWSAVLLGLVVGLLLGWALLPGLSAQQKLYVVFHGICAQSHNLVSGGVQLPLCARDSGMYLGYLVTLGVVLARRRGRAGRFAPWPVALAVLGLGLLMAADGLNSTLAELTLPHAYPPRNDLRLLTGMGAGVGLALLVYFVINTALRADLDEQLTLLGGWRDLGLILGLLGLIVAALAANTPLFAWPLALLLSMAAIGNLTALFMLFPALLSGRGGRVSHLAQLALPTVIGLLFAVGFLLILAFARFVLEQIGFLPAPLLP